MAKTVLLFAYHFPPVGGPTAQRALNCARYLPEVGYETVVLTGVVDEQDFWSPSDPSAGGKLPADLRVLRIDVPPTGRVRARAERLLALPSSFRRAFAREAARAVRGLRGEVDAMVCLFGLYDLGDAAMEIAHVLEVPWVADMQDPWALDEMWLYPSGVHRLLDRRRMGRTFADASAVIMNTPEAATRVRAAFPSLDPAHVYAIPNGFSADDRPQVEAPRNAAFRIVHAGSLHTEHGLRHRRTRGIRRLLGGMPVAGLDILTRSHVFLVQAVDRLLEARPELARTLEMHLVGPLTESDHLVAASSPVVRMHGFLPHGEATAMLAGADLLFLPMHDLPSGSRAGLVPTKTYEYAASGRPILAAVPEGDARDFLRAVGTATIVDPSDVEAMQRAIADRYDAWERGDRPPAPNEAVLAEFEYREIVRRIAQVLDDVVRE